MSVAIVTDSTICLPLEIVMQYGITVVPLNLVFEDKSYRDGVDMTPSEFYTLLEQSEKLPTTTAATTVDLLETYRKLSRQADSIACIFLSSKLSGSYDVAVQVKEQAQNEFPSTTIEVIDSRTTTGALGFIVLEAARAAASGCDLPQVLEVVNDMTPRVQFLAVLETLRYLAKGGRIGKASAWAGALLSVKPILTVSTATGEVVPIERPRTKSRAIRHMIELMKDHVGARQVHVNIMHANIPEEAEKLKAQVLSTLNCTELFTTEFTPVMGVHTGPGLVGMAFYCDDSR
ncbi:MAG: DegV family protein [Chloroflexota bacterium]|nr:DegV family protein [Chloroflexota bacterium]